MPNPNLAVLRDPALKTAYQCLRKEATRGKDEVLRVDTPHVTLTLKLGTRADDAIKHQTALRDAFLIHVDPKAPKCYIVEEVDDIPASSAAGPAADSVAAPVQDAPQEALKAGATSGSEELDERAFRILAERATQNKRNPGKINGINSLLRRGLDIEEDAAQAIVARLEAARRITRDAEGKNARNSSWSVWTSDAAEDRPPAAQKAVRAATAPRIAKVEKPKGKTTPKAEKPRVREPTTDVLRNLYRKLRRNAQWRDGHLVVDARNIEDPGEKPDTVRKRLYSLRDQGFIEPDGRLGWQRTVIVGAERAPQGSAKGPGHTPGALRADARGGRRKPGEASEIALKALREAATKNGLGRFIVPDPIAVVGTALDLDKHASQKALDRLEKNGRIKRTRGHKWEDVEVLGVSEKDEKPTEEAPTVPSSNPARSDGPAVDPCAEDRLLQEAQRIGAEISRHTDPVIVALLERERLRWLTAASDLRLARLLPARR